MEVLKQTLAAAITRDPQKKYKFVRTIGKGTFGEVYECEDENGTHVAMKKVLQDPLYKNRELEILKQLRHPNCLNLVDFFFRREGKDKLRFLYVVTNLFPKNLSEFMKGRSGPCPALVKVFTYQIFKGLEYMHSKGICHRDIKPSNVLVDEQSGRAQLCDFGSAKMIAANEESVCYIATRCYRAPELLYECTQYGPSVDVWAAGCVAGEMLNSERPVFFGRSNAEMIQEVASIIGSPTEEDMRDMNGKVKYTGPVIERRPLINRFPEWAPKDLIALLERIFVYSPKKRPTATQVLEDPYFADVRQGKMMLPNGLPFREEC